MLRNFLIVSCLAAGALALAGCQTTDGTVAVSPLVPSTGFVNPFNPVPGSTPEQVSQVIAAVQQDVRVGCGYVVKAQSILNIVAAFGVPYAGMAGEIGGIVCDALTKTSARRGGGRPSVVVNGRRITIEAKRA